MAYLDVKQHAIDRYIERVCDVSPSVAIAMIRRDIASGHPLKMARHYKWRIPANCKWEKDQAFIESADMERLYVLVGQCVVTVVTKDVAKGRLKPKDFTPDDETNDIPA